MRSEPTLNSAGEPVVRQQFLGPYQCFGFVYRKQPPLCRRTVPELRKSRKPTATRTATKQNDLSLSRGRGLIPVFHTKPITIFVFRKGAEDVEEQVHGSAEDCVGQADGGGAQGRGHSLRSGSEDTHELCLEVPMPGSRSTAAWM